MNPSTQIRRWQRQGLCGLLCLAVSGFAIAQTGSPTPPSQPAPSSTTPATKSQHPSTAHATSKHSATHASTQKSKGSHGKKSSKKRGQQGIDSARAREIQTALIREHYLQGEPSGSWDATTQAAMQRYQADQGWQSKTTPDSRALIKLGLGPSSDHLLNPESAMTATQAAGEAKSGAKPTSPENNLPQK